jgi:Family of unknown function (DUF6479)
MSALSEPTLAVARDYLVGIAPAAIGLLIAVGLVLAVVYGRRGRAKEPPAPRAPQPRAGAWQTREELGAPTPPDHGPGHQEADPVGYVRASRDPEEIEQVPHSRRLRPHQIRPYPGPRT